ncbi:MAG: autotransporter domain-containing protein [Alphaproteobacteria bacterium]|nr:autotransporter domain-containing protein [Alphaproteobacteria bacterium]
MKSKKAVIFVVALFLLFSGSPGFAATTTFNNGNGDVDWFNNGNWTAGTPSVSDDAIVDAGLPGYVLTLTAPAHMQSLRLGNSNLINLLSTTLSASGALTIGSVGGISTLNIINGSVVTFDAGVISTNSGQGHIIVNGGGSKLSGRTLIVGKDLGGVVTVENGGELNIDNGAGTIVLGDVGSGRLKVGDLSAHGIIRAAQIHMATSGSRIDFDFTDSYTLDASITGDGIIIKDNVGTLVLTGANTFTGGTSIYGGTIELRNAQALGTGLVALNDGTFLRAGINNMVIANDIITGCPCTFGTIDTQSFDMTLNGAIYGIGGLRKDGAGTLTYNGDGSSFGGVLYLGGGTFKIGDDAHSSATLGDSSSVAFILPNATLAGHGTFDGSVLNDGGTISPGGSIGTLTITGNYIQSSAATLAVSVSPSASSLLDVQGVASVNGGLNIIFEPGVYTPKTYTFLTGAGGVSGQFATITVAQVTDAGIVTLQTAVPTLYDATSVSFSVNAFTVSSTPSNSTSFMGLTSTAIQSSIRAGNTIFDQLSGNTNNSNDQTAALAFSSIGNSQLVNAENAAGINDIAKALPAVMKDKGGWFKAYGNLGAVDSTSANTGYSSQSGGFMFGADKAISKTLRIGAAGGYEHTDVDGFTVTKSEGAADTMRVALYGRQMVFDEIALDGQAGYALHMFDNQRFVGITGTDATSNHHGHEFSGAFQGSKDFRAAGFKLTPRAGLHFTHLYEDAFSESGAGAFNATFAEHDTDSLQLFTSFTAVAPTKDIEGYFVTPEAHIKYSYEALDASRKANGTARGVAFSASGVAAAKNTLSLGTSASVKLDDIVDGFISYDVRLPVSTMFDQTFALGVKIKF